jgi:hypothetical protein
MSFLRSCGRSVAHSPADLVMKYNLDAGYMAEFPDILYQVLSKTFNEPLWIAGAHATALFGPDMVAMAALAGCTSGLDKLEAVAALTYLQSLALKEGKSRFLRFVPGRHRKRYADLQYLRERTIGLIESHCGPGGKLDVFTAEMIAQMKSS